MRKTRKNALFLLLFSGFILTLHKGNLALLDGETGKAVEIFPVRAKLLPQADQQKLAAGIPADSPEALARLLEDFLS